MIGLIRSRRATHPPIFMEGTTTDKGNGLETASQTAFTSVHGRIYNVTNDSTPPSISLCWLLNQVLRRTAAELQKKNRQKKARTAAAERIWFKFTGFLALCCGLYAPTSIENYSAALDLLIIIFEYMI